MAVLLEATIEMRH